jgi:hypothetical protein
MHGTILHSLICFHGMVLTKHRNKFTFTFHVAGKNRNTNSKQKASREGELYDNERLQHIRGIDKESD